MLGVMIIAVSCENGGKKSTKNDSFFEGVFTPGILVAKYYNNNNAANLRYTIELELTIRDDRSFEMREKTSGLYGGNAEIKTYKGRITNKYSEVYNGVSHTWYTLEGMSGNWVGSWSIETDGTAVDGANSTYQEIYSRLNENRYEGWHWKMKRQ